MNLRSYITAYSSISLTVINALVILYFISVVSQFEISEKTKFTDLLLLIGLFPVFALGFPTTIVAQISREGWITESFFRKIVFYGLLLSLISFTICYLVFPKIWWLFVAAPLIFLLLCWRGYFEGKKSFWFSAGTKIIVSSGILILSSMIMTQIAFQIIFILTCGFIILVLAWRLKSLARPLTATEIPLVPFMLQSLLTISIIYVDKFFLKLTGSASSYVDFTLTHEAVYKIISLFMIFSIFHFPEINSKTFSERRRGITAYSIQIFSAFIIVIIFIYSGLCLAYLGALNLEIRKVDYWVFGAYIFPIASLYLQRMCLAFLKEKIKLLSILITLVASNIVGLTSTYLFADAFITLTVRGIIETVIFLIALLNLGLRSNLTENLNADK